jgi:diguanylate cyclase (GGDEF)-like protein
MQNIHSLLSRLPLNSLRSQILAFAILAVLVPSLVIATIAYVQNRRALTENIARELVTASAQGGREADVWLKERLYDLRVFASSYVVSGTLARGGGAGGLADYLGSVRARFSDYDELQLLDAKGRLVGSSAHDTRRAPLPADWYAKLESSRRLVSEPYWDEPAHRLAVILGVPVENAGGRIAGVLVARTNFASLAQMLRVFESQTAGQVRLVSAEGRLIADSRTGSASETARALQAGVLARLSAAEGSAIEYRGSEGTSTLGSARRVLAWFAVAEMPVAEVYRQASRLRNVTMLVTIVLLLFVGAVAYRLAALMVRPLDRLTSAAARVSAGDLAVDLPRGGSGELAYLTQVFNTMLESLRKHRADLERLSTTDSLTGLVNRRHLMKLLAAELERAQRTAQPFAILMLDVDHFKKYNDEHGHLAGDEVLARMGAVLAQCIRPYDCAARYGGEEFLVMLSGTAGEAAREVAERIRGRVGSETFSGGKVTISIGVAEHPAHGVTVEDVIGRADAALYEAKRLGRDRVVRTAS